MSGMRETRPEAPHGACLRPGVCRDLTCACARSACQPERNATAVGLPRPAAHGKCVCVRVRVCSYTPRLFRAPLHAQSAARIPANCTACAASDWNSKIETALRDVGSSRFCLFFPPVCPHRGFAALVFALPCRSGCFVMVFGPGRHLDRRASHVTSSQTLRNKVSFQMIVIKQLT